MKYPCCFCVGPRHADGEICPKHPGVIASEKEWKDHLERAKGQQAQEQAQQASEGQQE